MVLVALVGAILGLRSPSPLASSSTMILPAADLPRLAIVCLFLVLIIAATAIFQAIQGLLVMRIEGRVSATLIPAFWDRLLRLPSRFFGQYSAGELASRAMELSELFKRVSGRPSPRSSPVSSRSSTWAYSITTVGNWPFAPPFSWASCSS